jgi:adenylylsulfate kinase
MIYWFTGQPGAGKTTLAKELITYLGDDAIHIDGDDLRDIFQNKDYSEAGRRKNIERAQDIARFLNMKGATVVVSLVSPYIVQREDFKLNNTVTEIYVHTSDERGREEFHVKEYRKPQTNYIDIDTTNKSIASSFIDLIKQIDL